MADTKWLGLRLEKDLHARLRIHAIEEDRPVSAIVREAIQQLLAKPRRSAKAKAGAA